MLKMIENSVSAWTTIDWKVLFPILIVFGAAILGVLLEAFLPAQIRRITQIILSCLALVAALGCSLWLNFYPTNNNYWGNNYVVDRLALLAQILLLVVGLLAVVVFADRTSTAEGSFAAQVATVPGSHEESLATKRGLVQSEIYPLFMFSLAGMMVFPAANDLLTLFVALEVLSLPLYVMCAAARRRRLLSQEAALKYFLMGAFASAFFIFGVALVYAGNGSISYLQIMEHIEKNGTQMAAFPLLLIGMFFVLIGLLFKVGAAPFHAWTPDVYQGAPTPVTGFMAAATKSAAFFALLRFFHMVVLPTHFDLRPFAYFIVIVTMLIGTVSGIVQSDFKRMLAYSSIAHAGFILIAVFSGKFTFSFYAMFIYLLAYSLATVGAFAIINLVREHDLDGNALAEATEIKRWAGLGRSHPGLAACMTIFLLSFAGIPLTGGFVGKLMAFQAGVFGGYWILVVLAVLASAATAFFYFRLLVLMFFAEPEATNRVRAARSTGGSAVVIYICAVGTLILGVLPGLLFTGLIG